ncbi:efflux RND transporter periplasmic adaptor subunit [Mariniphaga sp.]|uniref:efflux RND transporter periplasmic adaptor subunit n=1 Tax=Mariniphaga sp. TaxID=1954475 RepID=UPI00356447D5
MKRFLIIPAVAILFFITSCAPESKNEGQAAQNETQNAEEVKSAFTLKKQLVSFSQNLPAELLPYEKAEIHAKVDGYVQAVFADIGDEVKKGQVLARLDAPEVAARHAEARAKYNETQARFHASRDKYSRIQNAAKQEGVISETEVIYAKNQMLSDSAALISAEATAEAYKQMQDYLTIRAPFNGIITARFTDVGHFVGKSGEQALFILENPSRLRLRVHVPESHVENIPSADNLKFTVDAAAGKTFRAKLSRKSGSINRETRTELWEYEYDNSAGDLKPGMYATANLLLTRSEESFVVPFPAVVTSMERKFVIRVNNGVAEWVDVQEGISLASGKEIFGNLKEGDTLLSRGSEELKSGSPVKIKNE